MRSNRKAYVGRLLACLIGFSATWNGVISMADEGMWLFNKVPSAHLKKEHNFEATQEWLDHLMLSSVRFNSGGSASFVSSNGLVLTNHHVASDTLYKLSTEKANILKDGFLASSLEEEQKAPDLELNQLIAIKDVTSEVNAAVRDNMGAAEAAKARQAKMGEIEKKSLDETGYRSDVVTLYGGGQYHLYMYKKYTDVRLVWAPETATAFFGGDADNFEYPRYCLDVTLFRVYEDGKPAKIEHFLKMNPDGAKQDDLVFVSGNPGRTRRIYTQSALEFQRDHRLVRQLDMLRRKEILLQQYGLEGEEQVRRARDDMFGIQNSRKAYTGMIAGLQDPSYMEKHAQSERDMLQKIQSDSKLSALASAWADIEKVQQRRKELLGQYGSMTSRLYAIAETLVLMAAEDKKPSNDRLREFRDSNRESLEQELYSPAPLYDDLERVQLADELARLCENRGGSHPVVLKLLAGKSPRERAAEAIAKTKLFDVEARKALAKGGLDAIKSSTDPLIEMAKSFEEEYRRLHTINDELDEQERQAYAKITQAKFAIEGDRVYPDATFTLRLAFGKVAGYELNGKEIAATTNMAGAFDHAKKHGEVDPYELPKSWQAAEKKIAGKTPFNFVCTADIIGGNSGSPIVDREGRMVGIIFDGNIESLTADFYYTDKVSRAVGVQIAGVLEALRNIYGAEKLADQMGK
jgi:Peptidase S46